MRIVPPIGAADEPSSATPRVTVTETRRDAVRTLLRCASACSCSRPMVPRTTWNQRHANLNKTEVRLWTAERNGPNTEVILAGEFPRRSGGTAFAANCLRALETETEPLCPPMLSDIFKGFGHPFENRQVDRRSVAATFFVNAFTTRKSFGGRGAACVELPCSG